MIIPIDRGSKSDAAYHQMKRDIKQQRFGAQFYLELRKKKNAEVVELVDTQP